MFEMGAFLSMTGVKSNQFRNIFIPLEACSFCDPLVVAVLDQSTGYGCDGCTVFKAYGAQRPVTTNTEHKTSKRRNLRLVLGEVGWPNARSQQLRTAIDWRDSPLHREAFTCLGCRLGL